MTRLIVVFQDLPVFSEAMECHRRAAARLGFVCIEESGAWAANRLEWNDPGNVILFWGGHPQIPSNRRARCALRYTESSGPPEGLIPNQRAEQDWLVKNGRAFDVVFVGTPGVKAAVEQNCKRTVAVPIGYDAGTMGIPDWNAKKSRELCFYGSLMGRRQWIIPFLGSRLGHRFHMVHKFGRLRQKTLNGSRAILYVGHSKEPGFPGLRLWQAIATSAALVTEDRDAWPAIAGRHYVPIPEAREDNPEELAASIESALDQPLQDIARKAHEELSTYTVDRCLSDYVMKEFPE
jgi:hypothetical protein